jgi:hypothetical protein
VFIFVSDKKEKTRVKLYDTISKRIAKKYKNETVSLGNAKFYIFTKGD